MATTYLGGQALHDLAAAQLALDAHPRSGAGICLGCRSYPGCAEYEKATRVFAYYHQLPRRLPGRTRAGPSGRTT